MTAFTGWKYYPTSYEREEGSHSWTNMAPSSWESRASRDISVGKPVSIGVFVDPASSIDTKRLLPDTEALTSAFVTSELTDARSQTVRTKPDAVVIFCDLVGPGLTFLKELKRNWPLPVIVVDASSDKPGELGPVGMEHGAHIVLDKPKGPAEMLAFNARITRILWPLLREGSVPGTEHASGAGSKLSLGCAVEPLPAPVRLIAIGASTGGLRSLGRLLDHLPANGPPVVVVQHMKAGYIARTAGRFESYYGQHCLLAQDGVTLRHNQVLFAPDGAHLGIANSVGQPVPYRMDPDPSDHFVPAVDRLFTSVADAFGPQAVGVILTGMGKDGASGLKKMRLAGARCVGEKEASCVVYGMPKVAKDMGAIDLELGAEEIGLYLAELIRVSYASRDPSKEPVYSRVG